jgi:hypothetical protein
MTRDERVVNDVRQVMQGNLADTTRGQGWRTCNDTKGGGNGDDDDKEEQYNPCGGNNDVTMVTHNNPLCTMQ